MKPERWKRIKELHARAQEQPLKERRAFLERECAGDEVLRKRVEAMLAQLISWGLAKRFLLHHEPVDSGVRVAG